MANEIKFETVKIESLNNVDHRIWKSRISYLLTHEKTLYTIQSEKPVEGSWAFEKWENDNEMARATILNHMEDDLIPLYKGYVTAKKIMDTLEDKYGPKSQTYIQLLLEKYNGIRMSENDSMVDHITKMEIMAKDLSNAGYSIPDKMQVSILLNSLPHSWEHAVTSLTYGQKELTMDTLPAVLAVEEVRMNHKKDNDKIRKSSLLLAEGSRSKEVRTNKKRTSKEFDRTQNKGKKYNCFLCGEVGHFKVNFPKGKKNNVKPKELIF